MAAHRYTVVWDNSLVTDFTNLWIDAGSAERRLLTEIATRIDRNLARAPNALGQILPSEPGARIWRVPGFDPPFSVIFQILPQERQVRVVRVSIRIA